MTLLVWIIWRLFQKRLAKPTSVCFVVAILVTSLVFGLGHLPIAFVVLPQITLAVVLFVILANSAFGIVAGYLYWKRGLEAAMIAHLLCHVVLAIASRAGAYF
jgi:membrane protease YdiL (CAAX protease family)